MLHQYCWYLSIESCWLSVHHRFFKVYKKYEHSDLAQEDLLKDRKFEFSAANLSDLIAEENVQIEILKLIFCKDLFIRFMNLKYIVNLIIRTKMNRDENRIFQISVWTLNRDMKFSESDRKRSAKCYCENRIIKMSVILSVHHFMWIFIQRNFKKCWCWFMLWKIDQKKIKNLFKKVWLQNSQLLSTNTFQNKQSQNFCIL